MKGVWAAIFSLPPLIAVFFVRDPQVIVTYTGGIAGTFILFIFPLTLVYFARKRESELLDEEKEQRGENFNASPLKSWFWWWLIAIFALITLGFVMWGICTGEAGE